MDFKSANGENTTVLNIQPESYITACFFAKESGRDIRLTENLNYASLIQDQEYPQRGELNWQNPIFGVSEYWRFIGNEY